MIKNEGDVHIGQSVGAACRDAETQALSSTSSRRREKCENLKQHGNNILEIKDSAAKWEQLAFEKEDSVTMWSPKCQHLKTNCDRLRRKI